MFPSRRCRLARVVTRARIAVHAESERLSRNYSSAWHRQVSSRRFTITPESCLFGDSEIAVGMANASAHLRQSGMLKWTRKVIY